MDITSLITRWRNKAPDEAPGFPIQETNLFCNVVTNIKRREWAFRLDCAYGPRGYLCVAWVARDYDILVAHVGFRGEGPTITQALLHAYCLALENTYDRT